MGHSIEDYLRRRTDEELEGMLTLYEPLTEQEYYANLVAMIQGILQERHRKKDQNGNIVS